MRSIDIHCITKVVLGIYVGAYLLAVGRLDEINMDATKTQEQLC
jgi:hypothetical protein